MKASGPINVIVAPIVETAPVPVKPAAVVSIIIRVLVEILLLSIVQVLEFNPAFGRENIKIIKKERIIGQEYIFNTRHISFYDINIDTPTQTNNIFNPINILINMPIIDNSIINIIGDDDGDEDGDDDGDEDGDDDGDDDEIEETNDTDSVS